MDEVTGSTLAATGAILPIVLALGVVGCAVALVIWLVRRNRAHKP